MCVFNGNAFAGGYLLGICHDSRMMNESVGNIFMTEMKYGMPLIAPMMLVCKAKLGHNVCLRLGMSTPFSPEKALRDGLIDYTYSSLDDLNSQLKVHVKKYGPLGAHR